MSEEKQKSDTIRAIYLDTSILWPFSISIDHPLFLILLEIADKWKFKIFIPEVAYLEWVNSKMENIEIDINRIKMSVDHLKEKYLFNGINLGDITAQSIFEHSKSILDKNLGNSKIEIIKTIEIDVRKFTSPAIEYLEKAISLLPGEYYSYHAQSVFVNSLASAYFKDGDLEKAQENYEKITRMTTGRLFSSDLYAKAFYMLGKIYEEQGDTAKAIEHYEKFLTLWKDADPGIVEVEDARDRLAGLKDS